MTTSKIYLFIVFKTKKFESHFEKLPYHHFTNILNYVHIINEMKYVKHSRERLTIM